MLLRELGRTNLLVLSRSQNGIVSHSCWPLRCSSLRRVLYSRVIIAWSLDESSLCLKFCERADEEILCVTAAFLLYSLVFSRFVFQGII